MTHEARACKVALCTWYEAGDYVRPIADYYSSCLCGVAGCRCPLLVAGGGWRTGMEEEEEEDDTASEAKTAWWYDLGTAVCKTRCFFDDLP